MPDGTHQTLLADNVHSAVVFVFLLIVSKVGEAFSEINENLPLILQWLAVAVAVTTLVRNVVALWRGRP